MSGTVKKSFIPGLGNVTSYADVGNDVPQPKPAEMVPGAPTEKSGAVGFGIEATINLTSPRALTMTAKELATKSMGAMIESNMAGTPQSNSATSETAYEVVTKKEPVEDEKEPADDVIEMSLGIGSKVVVPTTGFTGTVFRIYNPPVADEPRIVIIKSDTGRLEDFGEDEVMPSN